MDCGYMPRERDDWLSSLNFSPSRDVLGGKDDTPEKEVVVGVVHSLRANMST